ncbi:Cyclophilin type peptidyl-prolyl cis-trans isomerase/CLD [Seminavis robusta]|uniref:Cyclophilin type peptidyl-prolyl cis-trans isomerase/CLD n=1 Tax=Seminavis robusta TaxID=568900 RepID=A0A9N8EML9_9STRA|nr:Cyclophilin type peptidyl-prolyl cis-trans isomerase/CLD [Seminavis robusta]|eukprot:Sro1225_g254080.1 Cyclophilin type peptidyl-prolyl cis-trans isomerase/CLD (330) ;mRNA; r:9593-10582
MNSLPAFLVSVLFSLQAIVCCQAWSPHQSVAGRIHRHVKTSWSINLKANANGNTMDEELWDNDQSFLPSRRSWLLQSAAALTVMAAPTFASNAATSDAKVTDRIFLDIKGLGSEGPKRLVIGLFGNEAPQSTSMLKQLVDSSKGLPAPCKPKAERTLQKEQLEANKVYNTCIEAKDKGVNYEYSQIWRIIQNERIDVGSVSGKFIAREYPNWQEKENNQLLHDAPGIVSVRKGNDSGFGFTIYPGGGSNAVQALLDEEHIVVGRVENLELVQELNQVPVIQSSKVNYMGLTGGPTTKSAPTRACQYGGPMYCNENKPLIKLSVMNSGVL